MNSVMGVIFSNMHDFMVSELTSVRCMGSIPIGGRYRLIDFVLSSMANSGLKSVGVITKNNYQSLMDHLGSGREWDLNRKREGLIILPPFGRAEMDGMYRGRIDAYAGIMEFIERGRGDYVLSADCDWMANIDYTGFVAQHKKSGADITLMYTKQHIDAGARRDTGTLTLDGEGRLTEMLINPRTPGIHNVYMNMVIMSKELLLEVVADCKSRSLSSFDKDVIQRGIGRLDIRGYEFEGYARRLDSMQTYFKINQELLDPVIRRALFPADQPVYTKIRDEAPVRYGLDCKVGNSLIADGCLVEGTVENSLLFRGVKVEKGAVVRNCIVMQSTVVGAGSSLEYVIADKNVKIGQERNVNGFETYPVYLAKGAAV